MNYETAYRVGNFLSTLGPRPDGSNRRMVYISSSGNPPFINRYYETKLRAERALADMINLDSVYLRPGFIWSAEHRVWYKKSFIQGLFH